MAIMKAGDLPIASAEQIKAAWARRSFLKYCEMVNEGRWIPAQHHKLIAQKLQDVADGKIKRLMVWLPPRHGKSMEITETFPSYFLGKHPQKRVIIVSYNNGFAERFGLANRSKVEQYGRQIFGHSCSENKATKTNWNLDNDIGGLISVGVDGALTGEGADLLLIDDPIKNRQEAESKTYRRRLYEEYQSTLYTRVQRGAIIIVMTRWHEDDICGRLLNPSVVEKPEDWDVVSIPAVCESEDDLLGREIGEPLWAEAGYGQQWVEETKAAVGSYVWAGMYQQRPAPMEGGMFKRKDFRFYQSLPANITQAVQSWDCTFKEGDDTDYVAGHVWGRRGADYYLIDRIHDRMGITETMQGIRALEAKHPYARAKGIEEAANGAAVIELLRNTVSGLIPIRPDGGKVARAQYIIPYMEGGNIWLPDPSIAPWVHDFVEEFASFPNAAHDDDVDAATQAIKLLDSLFGSGGGMIYRVYTESPESFRLPRAVLETRMKNAYGVTQIDALTIGIASESTAFGTSFVATAIPFGFGQVYVVGTHECANNATPDEIAAALIPFAQTVSTLAGRPIDYVVMGRDNDILYRTIRARLESNRIYASVRTDARTPEKDLISVTLSTMSARKLLLSQEDAGALHEAFMIAQWKDDRTVRDDSGAANTLILRAFERSIERNRRNLI